MSTPLTLMEQGQSRSMTPSEGENFIQAVSASPYTTTEIVTKTSNGAFDIYRVTVTEADQDAPTILVTGGQHGNEPVGWEAALRWMRDAAFSDSPLWADLRQKVRFVFIPMVSPAAMSRRSRLTPTPLGDVDVNREHITLRTNEARAVQGTITKYSPIMLVDCHEYGGSSASTAVMPGLSKHPQADEKLLELADGLYDWVESDLNNREIDNRQYPPSTAVDTLRNVATLRHALGFLIETPFNNPNIPPSDRAEWFMIVINALLEWTRNHLHLLLRDSHGSRRRKIEEGLNRSRPFNLISTTLNPPPVGYFGVEGYSEELAILGVDKTENMIMMGQAAQPIIPYMFDRESEYSLTTGHRYSPRIVSELGHAVSGEPDAIRVNVGGVVQDINQVRVGTSSRPITVWERPEA